MQDKGRWGVVLLSSTRTQTWEVKRVSQAGFFLRLSPLSLLFVGSCAKEEEESGEYL